MSKKLSFVMAMLISASVLIGCGSKNDQTVFEVDYMTKYSYNDTINESKVEHFKLDYADFINADDKAFNKNIALFDVIQMCDTYEAATPIYVKNGDKFENDGTSHSFIKYFGLKDIEDIVINGENYNSDKEDVLAFICSHYDFIFNNKKYQLFNIAFKGSSSNIEWYSNFDLGIDDPMYINDAHKHAEWQNKSIHKGFDIATARMKPLLTNYIDSHKQNDATIILNMTGHSRGSAVLNIFAKKYNDLPYKTFAYTYATPNTTREADLNCDYLFNIVNGDDAVPILPPENVGFKRYGKTYTVSCFDNYKSQFEAYFNNKIELGQTDINSCKEGFKKIFISLDDYYKNLSHEGDRSFKTQANAKEFYDELKATIDADEAKYYHFASIEAPVLEDDEYVVKFSCSSAILQIIISHVFVGEPAKVATYIPLIMPIVLSVIPEIGGALQYGVNGYNQAHMFGTYCTIVKNYNFN